MTKADFIEEIAKVLRITRKEAQLVFNVILDSMVRALHKADRVELRGFGSFSTHVRDSRVGRNPRTGLEVYVPAKRVLNFRPSKELRDLINGGPDRDDAAGAESPK